MGAQLRTGKTLADPRDTTQNLNDPYAVIRVDRNNVLEQARVSIHFFDRVCTKLERKTNVIRELKSPYNVSEYSVTGADYDKYFSDAIISADGMNPEIAGYRYLADVHSDGESEFTADDATNVITATAHGMSDDDVVLVESDDTLPAGLSQYKIYFVIDSDADTLKLSLTQGGAEIDITDTGTGTHQILKRLTWAEDWERTPDEAEGVPTTVGDRVWKKTRL